MDFLEKDLEELIFENRSRLPERGLNLRQLRGSWAKMNRQVQLGSYGVADLILIEGLKYNRKTSLIPFDAFSRILSINIIECKLNTIDFKAYLQAKRYVTAVKHLINDFDLSSTEVRFHTTLIGSKIDTSGDFVYALNEDENCSCYTYKYDFDGIVFSEKGKNWQLTSAILPKEKVRNEFLDFYKCVTLAEFNEREILKSQTENL